MPSRFPNLITTMTVDRGMVTFTVREGRTGGDHTRVEVTPDHAVTISAGPGGVAPLYVATDGHGLVGSWDPADLAAFASAGALAAAVVARLLTRRHRYSTDTLFSTVTRVTAGVNRPGWWRGS
jgi:hypothetical protein